MNNVLVWRSWWRNLNILEVLHSYTKKHKFYQFILEDMIENQFGLNWNFIYICASAIFLSLRELPAFIFRNILCILSKYMYICSYIIYSDILIICIFCQKYSQLFMKYLWRLWSWYQSPWIIPRIQVQLTFIIQYVIIIYFSYVILWNLVTLPSK